MDDLDHISWPINISIIEQLTEIISSKKDDELINKTKSLEWVLTVLDKIEKYIEKNIEKNKKYENKPFTSMLTTYVKRKEAVNHKESSSIKKSESVFSSFFQSVTSFFSPKSLSNDHKSDDNKPLLKNMRQ